MNARKRCQVEVKEPLPGTGALEMTPGGMMRLTLEIDVATALGRAVLGGNPDAIRSDVTDTVAALMIAIGGKMGGPVAQEERSPA